MGRLRRCPQASGHRETPGPQRRGQCAFRQRNKRGFGLQRTGLLASSRNPLLSSYVNEGARITPSQQEMPRSHSAFGPAVVADYRIVGAELQNILGLLPGDFQVGSGIGLPKDLSFD